MHYVSLVLNRIVQINFGLKPNFSFNFGLKPYLRGNFGFKLGLKLKLTECIVTLHFYAN